MVDGMLFPTKSAALCLQQEVGFIYKNHSPKLTFVGLCTFPPSFPSPARHIPPPKIPQWPQSKKHWRMLWKMRWTNIGGSFLEGETEAWRAQWLTQGNRTCGCPRSQATAFLIAPWLLRFMCPQPGLCIDMPSSPLPSAWRKSPYSEWPNSLGNISHH